MIKPSVLQNLERRILHWVIGVIKCCMDYGQRREKAVKYPFLLK
jgi:hypothetical protein